MNTRNPINSEQLKIVERRGRKPLMLIDQGSSSQAMNGLDSLRMSMLSCES